MGMFEFVNLCILSIFFTFSLSMQRLFLWNGKNFVFIILLFQLVLLNFYRLMEVKLELSFTHNFTPFSYRFLLLDLDLKYK